MRPCLALFLVFFTLSKAWAALTFSWERSTTTGHDRLELSDQSERWLIKKTSN